MLDKSSLLARVLEEIPPYVYPLDLQEHAYTCRELRNDTGMKADRSRSSKIVETGAQEEQESSRR